MEKNEVILAVCFISFLLVLLAGFLLFVLLWQRRKSNAYLTEKERMQAFFNEQLLRSQLEVQEQTFAAISGEIHDNVGQILSLAKVQLNIMEQGEGLNKSLLTDVKDSVSKAMADLRDIASSLSPERIQRLSLPEMVGSELSRLNRSAFLSAQLDIEGKEQPMQDHKKLILFRMIQEALQNILKHSGAKTIRLAFRYAPDKLEVEVRDNGSGFDSRLLTGKEGLGINNIIGRAALIGGRAIIESEPHKGTIVNITIPYA